MKMITAEALERCLLTGQAEVHVDPSVAARARRAVEAMIATSPASVPAGA
jgi:quinolinate synthase